MNARHAPVIALDGPAGAGKSTAARRLAARLGYLLVDTGALYRGLALAAHERGVPWDEARALGDLATGLDLRMTAGEGGQPHLWIDGRDRSDEIRTAAIARGASDVSKHPEVRAALLGLQRQLGAEGGVVLEGRDIGTVVFPDAEVKVFITASPEVRARRRHEELRARGAAVGYDQTLRELRSRDEQDSNRPVAPLRKADDAVELDTSDLTEEQVLDRLLTIVRERGGAPPR